MSSLINIDFGDIVILVIGLILFLLFLQDFKPHSKRSWITLLCLFGAGGYVWIQRQRRKELLKDIEKKEDAIRAKEIDLTKLKDDSKISLAAYQNAIDELNAYKQQTADSILELEKELSRKRQEIDDEFEEIRPEDLRDKVKELLRR